MARLGLTVFMLVLVAASCRENGRPPGVLSKEEYAALLVDIYLAESRLSGAVISRDSATKLYLPYKEKLLKSRGISDSILRTTFQYYLDRPLELELVYTSVIDTLSLREQKYQRRK